MILTYDNVYLVPNEVSEIESRDLVILDIECFGIKLNIPIIASPMPDVCNGEMAYELARSGAFGIIHRFQTIEEQVRQFQCVPDNADGFMCDNAVFLRKNIACAIGVTGDYQERFKELYYSGCRIFCLDTANGASILVKKAVEWIRNQNHEIKRNLTLPIHFVLGVEGPTDCTLIVSNNECSREYGVEGDGWKLIDKLHSRLYKEHSFFKDFTVFKEEESYNEALEILYSENLKDYIKEEKFNYSYHDKVYIIAGNVATAEGYEFLANLGVDAVRVGIAGGSVCETRNETGIYLPTLESVKRCAESKKNITHKEIQKKMCEKHKRLFMLLKTSQSIIDFIEKSEEFNESIKKLPLIIADGGIKTPGDVMKALAAGADLVMCGSVFAPTNESGAEVIKWDGKYFKKYRGAASYGVQKEYTGKSPDKNEGDEILIEFRKDSVEKVIKRFSSGMKSSMSYLNCKDLKTFNSKRDKIVEIH